MAGEAGKRARSTDRRSLDGIAYRASRPDHTDLGTSAVASRRNPGRFNTEDVAALYLCRDAPTAVEEFQASEEGRGGERCVVSIVQFALIHVLDLTDRSTCESWDLTMADFIGGDVTRCRTVGATAAARGWQAIQWPASTGRESCLAVFLELLTPDSTVQLLRVIDPPNSR